MDFFRKNESNEYNVTMNDLRNDIHPSMATDPAFQANERGRWDLKNQQEYILSTITGAAPSKFVLADVEACLAFAEKNGNIEDAEYYRGWLDKGVKYINIDSHNRNQAIKDFLDNLVSLKEGIYDIPGYVNYKVTGKKYFWNNIKEDLQNYFLNEVSVSIQIYVDATREDLSNLARCVNLGLPWNAAEMRNTYISIVAETYRELANTFMPFFEAPGCKFIKSKELNRRGVDDFMVSLGSCAEFGFNHPSAKTKDEMYKERSSHEKTVRKIGTKMKQFFNLLQDNNGKDLYCLVSKTCIYDLWSMFWDLTSKSKKIDDDKASNMISDYMNCVIRLKGSKDLYNVSNDKSLTFAGMTNLSHGEIRCALIKKEFNIEEYAIDLGPRSQSPNNKLLTASAQNWKTPEGKEIPPSELHTPEWHNGHTKPWSQGGEEFIIQQASDNLKLGANPVV